VWVLQMEVTDNSKQTAGSGCGLQKSQEAAAEKLENRVKHLPRLPDGRLF
jgi:hypothetical protein